MIFNLYLFFLFYFVKSNCLFYIYDVLKVWFFIYYLYININDKMYLNFYNLNYLNIFFCYFYYVLFYLLFLFFKDVLNK